MRPRDRPLRYSKGQLIIECLGGNGRAAALRKPGPGDDQELPRIKRTRQQVWRPPRFENRSDRITGLVVQFLISVDEVGSIMLEYLGDMAECVAFQKITWPQECAVLAVGLLPRPFQAVGERNALVARELLRHGAVRGDREQSPVLVSLLAHRLRGPPRSRPLSSRQQKDAEHGSTRESGDPLGLDFGQSGKALLFFAPSTVARLPISMRVPEKKTP